ncbi:MAG TPA: regulatory protein RecX [Bacteroidia bacterium]|nr:regulatory protein RecX [Bacteroidia bacterium]
MFDKPEYKKRLSPEQALIRIRKYCAYQERSQQEVRNKLFQWGLYSDHVESMIVDLIEDNFIKEERFASAFTGGKFRQKKWGKLKIKRALKEKKITEPLIKKALSQIQEKEYLTTLKAVIKTRGRTEKETNPYKRKYKLAAYAIQRGFEPELVWSVIGQPEND